MYIVIAIADKLPSQRYHYDNVEQALEKWRELMALEYETNWYLSISLEYVALPR